MEEIQKILNTIFGNKGTKIEASSLVEVYNENSDKNPLSSSVSLNLNLKLTEDEKYEVTADLFAANPEKEDHKVVKLTAKKSFIEALTIVLLEAKDSVKVEKIL
jgi:hypothetical protein